MLLDRLHQVLGAPVVQEEDALTDAPQRSRAELAAIGIALRHAVRQPATHVMQREVRVRLEGHIAQRRDRGLTGGQAAGVTGLTADIREHLTPTVDGRA